MLGENKFLAIATPLIPTINGLVQSIGQGPGCIIAILSILQL